jgi:hypothetical protein
MYSVMAPGWEISVRWAIISAWISGAKGQICRVLERFSLLYTCYDVHYTRGMNGVSSQSSLRM